MQLVVKIILILVIIGIVSTCVTFGILDIIKQLQPNDMSESMSKSMNETNFSHRVKLHPPPLNKITEDIKDVSIDIDNAKSVPKLISRSYYTGPLVGKTQQVLCGKVWNNIDVNYDLPVDQNLGPVSPENKAM